MLRLSLRSHLSSDHSWMKSRLKSLGVIVLARDFSVQQDSDPDGHKGEDSNGSD